MQLVFDLNIEPPTEKQVLAEKNACTKRRVRLSRLIFAVCIPLALICLLLSPKQPNTAFLAYLVTGWTAMALVLNVLMNVCSTWRAEDRLSWIDESDCEAVIEAARATPAADEYRLKVVKQNRPLVYAELAMLRDAKEKAWLKRQCDKVYSNERIALAE